MKKSKLYFIALMYILDKIAMLFVLSIPFIMFSLLHGVFNAWMI